MSNTRALLQSLFEYKTWANNELFVALQGLGAIERPDDLHTAIRILNHIYVVDRIFAANLQKIPHEYTATNTTNTPTLEELRAQVQDTDRWYLDYVGQISTESLDERVAFVFTDGDAGQMSRAEMLMHVITHGGYHRGAVGRIMAQLSIAPPRDIFTRFLHQSDVSRRVI